MPVLIFRPPAAVSTFVFVVQHVSLLIIFASVPVSIFVFTPGEMGRRCIVFAAAAARLSKG